MYLPILTALPKFGRGDAPLMTKTFTATETIPYGDAYEFSHDGETAEFENIEHLSCILDLIQDWHSSCVIRGRLIEGRTDPVLRRKDAWGGQPAFFEMVPEGISWCMIDMDKVPAPPDLHPDDRINYLVGLLPEYLRDTSYHYQWSSSAGTKGWDLLSIHMWFCLSEPRTDAQMERWASMTHAVDPAVMRTVQVHYTSRPRFIGRDDPMGSERSGLIRKTSDTALLPIMPEPTPIKSSGFRPLHQNRSPMSSFEHKIDQIGPRLHQPINSAIASYIACGGHDFAYLKDRIRQRLACCPTDGQDPRIYTNDRYLDASIRGAQRKFTRLL
jgi:hypothetical protein